MNSLGPSFLVFLSLHLCAWGDAEWNSFRGPTGMGVEKEKTLLSWNASSIKWKKEITGSGQSSVVQAGGKLFLTSADREGGLRFIHCLDKDTGEKVFGYMESVPPVGADGNDDFTGMVGIMCTVVWWRWLEKQGPGGRVAIDIIEGPRFRVLSNAPSEEEVGVDGAPPLMVGEVELLENATRDDDFDLDLDEDFDLDVLGEGLGAGAEPDPEYTWTHSTATTEDVEVRVRSGFQGVDRSANTMVWAYEVTIYNKGELPVKVLSRHWIITDSNGEIQEVGPGAHGILGETPTVGPGRAVRYTSSTPLKTEYGTMEGSFELEVQSADAEAEESEPRTFNARVAKFGLSMDGKPVKVELELGA